MAIVSILAGGIMGFFSALVGLIVLNVSWMAAFGLWTGVGALAAGAVLVLAMMPGKGLPLQTAAPLNAKTA